MWAFSVWLQEVRSVAGVLYAFLDVALSLE